MQAVLDKVEAVFTWTAVGVAAVTMVLTTADALGRYLFSRPIVGAFEITADYLLVALVFLATSYSYRTGCFVRVTFFLERVSPRVRLVSDHLAQLLSILIAVALVVSAAMQARRTLSGGTLSTSLLAYPLGPAHVVGLLGLVMMTIRLIADVPRVRTGESGMQREDTEAL
jgi:TRAP-type C4-dicarboxylate transport system permease small subunit